MLPYFQPNQLSVKPSPVSGPGLPRSQYTLNCDPGGRRHFCRSQRDQSVPRIQATNNPGRGIALQVHVQNPVDTAEDMDGVDDRDGGCPDDSDVGVAVERRGSSRSRPASNSTHLVTIHVISGNYPRTMRVVIPSPLSHLSVCQVRFVARGADHTSMQ